MLKCEYITAVSLNTPHFMTPEWFYVYMYIFVSESFLTLCCYDSFPSVAKILRQSNIQTITFYNKLVVLYCLFSSLLKWLLTFFLVNTLKKKKISVLFLIPCSSFKIWRPFIRYLMYRTVFYCVVFYFSVPQSVFVFNDAWPDWTRRIISVHLSTRGQFSHVWPEMNMCMLSVICSGILCYVYVLVFVIFFCCVCFEKGTFHK